MAGHSGTCVGLATEKSFSLMKNIGNNITNPERMHKPHMAICTASLRLDT